MCNGQMALDPLVLFKRDHEMDDIVRLVREEGYVLIWSNVLGDGVTLIYNDYDPSKSHIAFNP